MANRILITPDEHDEAAAYLRERMTNINEEVRLLQTKVEGLQWEGNAKEAFTTQFNSEIVPVLTKNLPDLVEGVAKNLNEIARIMRETDEAIANASKA